MRPRRPEAAAETRQRRPEDSRQALLKLVAENGLTTVRRVVRCDRAVWHWTLPSRQAMIQSILWLLQPMSAHKAARPFGGSRRLFVLCRGA